MIELARSIPTHFISLLNMLLRSLLLLLGVTCPMLAIVWSDSIPLGIPGEWTWGRHLYGSSELIWSLMLGVIGAVLYVLFVMWGDRCPAKTETSCNLRLTRNIGWLVGLVVAGFGWLWLTQSVTNPGVGLAKGPLILYSKSATGYFLQARYDVVSTPEFLAGYESLVSGEATGSRDVLHIGTHPPGLTLCYRGLIDLCRRFPKLTQLLLVSQPDVVRRQTELIQRDALRNGREFGDSEAATLWLAFLLTQCAAALTVLPLYLWLRETESKITAWRVCTFWPIVPAVAVFLPKSDVLFPLIAMTAASCWRISWRHDRRWLAIAAGGLLWCGMFLSLAFLAVGAWLIVQTLCDGWPPSDPDRTTTSQEEAKIWHRQPRVRRAALLLSGGAVGFLAPVLLLWWLADLNLLAVWIDNYRNHALFYQQFTRTYGAWLWENPIELTAAIGVPIVLALSLGLVRVWQDRKSFDLVTALRRTSLPATAIILGLLWLSGKNSGEASRLWILFFPSVLACTAPFFRASTSQTDDSSPAHSPDPLQCEALADRPSHWRWSLYLLIASLASLLTTLRVDGFHFRGM